MLYLGIRLISILLQKKCILWHYLIIIIQSMIYFFLIILLVFKYSCLHLLPTTPPTPATSLPWFHPPLVLSMCPLYLFLKTLPPFIPIIPSHLPSGYCQIVLNFNVSGYILLACLFVLLIRFHLKVRSHGICPSLPGLFHLA